MIPVGVSVRFSASGLILKAIPKPFSIAEWHSIARFFSFLCDGRSGGFRHQPVDRTGLHTPIKQIARDTAIPVNCLPQNTPKSFSPVPKSRRPPLLPGSLPASPHNKHQIQREASPPERKHPGPVRTRSGRWSRSAQRQMGCLSSILLRNRGSTRSSCLIRQCGISRCRSRATPDSARRNCLQNAAQLRTSSVSHRTFRSKSTLVFSGRDFPNLQISFLYATACLLDARAAIDRRIWD